MPRFLVTLVSCAMLAACNTNSFSYSASKIDRMDTTEFSDHVVKAEYGSGKLFVLGLHTITPPAVGETVYMAPKITYFFGTNGRLVARKKSDGSIKYSFYTLLQYQDDSLRRYDRVTDMSGSRLNFNIIAAYAYDGGYMREVIAVDLTEQQLTEAQTDGLFISMIAKQHEKRMAKTKGSNIGIMSALALADEINNGTVRNERKENDNYDLSVTSSYIVNFMNEVNK